jgi:hypothetical protein
VTLRLAEIRDLAYRFVPPAAADERMYQDSARAWWGAHEIGHFLVATAAECRSFQFGLEFVMERRLHRKRYRYTIAKEMAATSISQRLLRRAGHTRLADDEIQYTDECVLDCVHEPWGKHAVTSLFRTHRVQRLPTTARGLERLLTRKAREVGTKFYTSRRAAEGAT